MAKLDLMLTARQYDADLGLLRKTIVLDRAPQLCEVRVLTEFGNAVTLFIDHQTLYVVGIEFGRKPRQLRCIPDAGFPPVPGATPFEFGGNYNDLRLYADRIELSGQSLAAAVSKLDYHEARGKGSDFLLSEKHDLIRLIFAVSEALRFWTIQRDVSRLLADPSASLVINDYAGNGKPLNSWETWSRQFNWPGKGVFVPKV